MAVLLPTNGGDQINSLESYKICDLLKEMFIKNNQQLSI